MDLTNYGLPENFSFHSQQVGYWKSTPVSREPSFTQSPRLPQVEKPSYYKTDFIRQTTEIQQELYKLSSLCKQQSPLAHQKKSLSMEVGPQKKKDSKWAVINSLLKKQGHSELRGVDYEALLDKLLDVLSRKQETPLATRSTTPMTEFEVTSRTFIGCEEESMFQAFMKRQFNPNKEEDKQVMGIITMYEEEKKVLKKQLKGKNFKDSQHVVSSLCAELSVNSENLISKIKEIQQISKKSAKFQNIVNNIYKDLFNSEPAEADLLFSEVAYLVNSKQEFDSFKEDIQTALDLDSQTSLQGIVSTCKSLGYLKSLFELKGDLVKEADSLFLFFHEIKSFVNVMRRTLKLPFNTETSEVLDEIKSLIFN